MGKATSSATKLPKAKESIQLVPRLLQLACDKSMGNSALVSNTLHQITSFDCESKCICIYLHFYMLFFFVFLLLSFISGRIFQSCFSRYDQSLDLSGSAHMGEKSISFLAHVTWTAESWLLQSSEWPNLCLQHNEMDQQRSNSVTTWWVHMSYTCTSYTVPCQCFAKVHNCFPYSHPLNSALMTFQQRRCLALWWSCAFWSAATCATTITSCRWKTTDAHNGCEKCRCWLLKTPQKFLNTTTLTRH